jgi:hypothetical protein
MRFVHSRRLKLGEPGDSRGLRVRENAAENLGACSGARTKSLPRYTTHLTSKTGGVANAAPPGVMGSKVRSVSRRA